MKNNSVHPRHIHLNFNYDKNQNNKGKKAISKSSFGRINNNNNPELLDNAKKYLDKKKNNKEKGEIKLSYIGPKFNDKNEALIERVEKNNNNLIKEYNNENNLFKNKEKEKEIKIKDDKEKNELIDKIGKKGKKDIIDYSCLINSINDIRLPKEFYDISYDILQNK